MYAKSVTEKHVAEMSEELGWKLEYHTISDVADMNRRLDAVIEPDTGKMTRPLNEDERRWIRNEQILSKFDFFYWATHYAKIIDWKGNLVLFKPNVAQQIKLEIWAWLEEQGRAISEQDLKARQLGVTTVVEAAVAHRTQFYPHTNSLVGSSDPDKSEKMAHMMERIWANQPWWLVPRQTAYRAGTLIEFGDIDSGVSIQHGAQTSGIGRGSTPTVCHLSELCDYPNPKDLVDASLLRAMHESPWMFLVLESTAAGRRNWWHDTWEFSKENYFLGRARLFPMFLPWFVGSDIYPTETWSLSHPIPDGWQPLEITRHHAARAKAYVQTEPILKKFLGEHWEMPKVQMWWWEVTRAEYAAKKELSKFYQETPADDMEAFQSTNISVFDPDTLSVYRENTTNPLGVYGFLGRQDEIPERLQPSRRDIDANLPPITIRARWNSAGNPFECQLTPLKFHGYSSTDPNGKLFIWEMPEDDQIYGIGVDTSDGVGLDRSVLEGLRKGSIERNNGQVCEFASPYINAYDLWPICMAVGSLYSTKIAGSLRQAKMVIECKGNGESTQLELRKRGWSNFHHWLRYDNKRLQQSRSNKLGWFTNAWSRPMMLDFIMKNLRDEWVDIWSPWFVDEMADLERDEMEQSLRAGYGGHDDRIIALGIVLFSLHVLELRGGQQLVAPLRARDNSPGADPVYTAGWQATDEHFGSNDLAELERRVEDYRERVIL